MCRARQLADSEEAVTAAGGKYNNMTNGGSGIHPHTPYPLLWPIVLRPPSLLYVLTMLHRNSVLYIFTIHSLHDVPCLAASRPRRFPRSPLRVALPSSPLSYPLSGRHLALSLLLGHPSPLSPLLPTLRQVPCPLPLLEHPTPPPLSYPLSSRLLTPSLPFWSTLLLPSRLPSPEGPVPPLPLALYAYTLPLDMRANEVREGEGAGTQEVPRHFGGACKSCDGTCPAEGGGYLGLVGRGENEGKTGRGRGGAARHPTITMWFTLTPFVGRRR